MLGFFERDPEQVRWELASCVSGACRLIVHHAQGTSVETFASTAQALRRVQQLEVGEQVKSLCGDEFYKLVLRGVEVNHTRSHI